MVYHAKARSLPAEFFRTEITDTRECLVFDKIAQWKPLEPALQQNEERGRQLVRNAPVAMIVSSRETQEIELANERSR
jgi:hypothetical protein